MSKAITIKIKNNIASKMKNGYPLIQKDSIINQKVLSEEGALIKLVDEQNHFIGKGYFGKQNKGYGWILTNNEDEQIDATFFTKKIRTGIDARQSFFLDTETTAFRVFNGEGDGIGGFTVEYFDGYYLIQWYSKGIYAYKDWVVSAIKQAPNFKGLYEKKRFDTKGQYIEDDDFVTGERSEFPLIIKENGVKYAIYLNESAMVGIFLDQREVRKRIRDSYAEGKNVLNTFSYTGAFSVAAALGGADKTTSVDLANRSRAKTIEQFSLNEIDYEAQSIIVEDVFKYFKYAVKKSLLFDMVILDPPSFARSKKMVFSAEKDYTNLLKETIAITAKKGIIVASTNSSAFPMKKFKSFIDTAFKETGEKYRILETYALPEDFRTIKAFPEGNYLKVVFIEKQ